MMSLATESILSAAARFAVGDPAAKIFNTTYFDIIIMQVYMYFL